MSGAEPTGPLDGSHPSAAAELRAEALEIARVQAAALALHDATAFLRNTYTVGTAGIAAALASSLRGDADAAAVLGHVRESLELATLQYERVLEFATVVDDADGDSDRGR